MSPGQAVPPRHHGNRRHLVSPARSRHRPSNVPSPSRTCRYVEFIGPPGGVCLGADHITAHFVLFLDQDRAPCPCRYGEFVVPGQHRGGHL